MSLLKKALKIKELEVSLENISQDDKKKLEEYSDEEIMEEARYVLSTFFEGGHNNNDILIGEWGDKQDQKEAKKQVNALKRLLRG